MKKRLFNMLPILGLALILVFTSSCEKDEDINNPTPTLSTATITGFVYANLDLSNDTNEFGGYEMQYEKAPNGTILHAYIDAEDFVSEPQAGVVYQNLSYTTTVGNDGSYTFELPAVNKDVTVRITADEFSYNKIVNDSTNEMTNYAIMEQSPSIIAGISKIIDFYYFED